jgi:hypothetical protein
MANMISYGIELLYTKIKFLNEMEQKQIKKNRLLLWPMFVVISQSCFTTKISNVVEWISAFLQKLSMIMEGTSEKISPLTSIYNKNLF